MKVRQADSCPNEGARWHKQQAQCASCAIVCTPSFQQAKPSLRAMLLLADWRKHSK